MMPTQRQVLDKLKLEELRASADAFGVEVEDKRRKDSLIDALVRAPGVTLTQIIERLQRDRLKALCKELGLDTGRTKAEILERLTTARTGVADRHRSGQGVLSFTPVTFTVDTHIFRELGELLVGRDSTALVELIKNAYDADAEEVLVYGEALGDPERGFIQIVDQRGNGMTGDEFTRGFLRIASRIKEAGERRSQRYHRRYTGAKGIGRLAAHKLAREMEVFTVPWIDRPKGQRHALTASINWDKVEECETLGDLESAKAVLKEMSEVPARTPVGTEITLRRLRGKWSSTERKRFIDEIQTFQPAAFITESIEGIVPETVLFDEVTVRGGSDTGDPGFRVRLEGDFEPGEDYWDVIAQAAHWVIEIDASPGTGQVRYGIAPTKTLLREMATADTVRYDMPHQAPEDGPFFQARVLVREPKRRGSQKVQEWARRVTGIRVFVEGFRVPPYGERGSDWLEIDVDYAQRSRPIQRLDKFGFANPASETEGLSQLAGSSYFGSVFLTQEGATGLRPLVNREGFVHDASYHRLVEMVRVGIDLSTRRRAELSHKKNTAKQTRAEPTISRQQTSAGQTLAESIAEVSQLFRDAKESAAVGDLERESQKFFQELEMPLREVEESHAEAAREATMLQVIASLGTQMAGFVHEIQSLLEMAGALELQLAKILMDIPMERPTRLAVGSAHRSAEELRRSLERQASYLVNIVTPDARRRRSRQKLRNVFDASWRLVARQAERRDIQVINKIPENLKSPPMFKAEVVAVFSNLLTNAVKAAGTPGKIRARGRKSDKGLFLQIENTGVAVDPAQGEQWFQPFKSTTVEIDPGLGQGMGLGLTIARSILEEYGAMICFTRPAGSYATALEVIFPDSRRTRK